MEVEVKLKLPNSNSHQSLLSLLSPFHTQTLLQENIFFDNPTSHLATNHAALRLRLRFHNHNHHHHTRCVLSLKSNPTLSNGVSRIEELEHELDPLLGRACVAEPWRLARLDRPNKVLEKMHELGLRDGPLVCLGGFKNVRNVYAWKGLKLEVDETVYEFGTSYEVECESESPQQAKKMIEELLKSNGIEYSYSQDNKFDVFRSRNLPL